MQHSKPAFGFLIPFSSLIASKITLVPSLSSKSERSIRSGPGMNRFVISVMVYQRAVVVPAGGVYPKD